MTQPPTLWYLVGPPAVGKLTTAREIGRRTGAIVVDNHLWNDPVFVPVGTRQGTPMSLVEDLRNQIRGIVLEAVERAPGHLSHVFTHWLEDAPQNWALVEEFRSLAARRGATFRPVWLTADEATIRERLQGPDRLAKAKLTDDAVLVQLLAEGQLAAPDDALVLDTTGLTVAEAVDRIVASRQPARR